MCATSLGCSDNVYLCFSIWLKVTFHNIDNVALCTKSNKAAAQRRPQQAHNAACVASVCSSQRSSQTQTVPPKEF